VNATAAATTRSVHAVEAHELTKRFGDRTVVDRLSFVVPWGAVTGFVGGNGSGKTTTIRTLLGLTIPTEGTSGIAGKPMVEHDEPRHVVGAALDRLGALPGMTGHQHLTMLSTAAGLAQGRVDGSLDRVDLADAADRRIRTYSTGMRQRLALAAALLGEPPILLLDEPSNGLDPAGIRWLRDLLRAHAASGGAVFVSTHHLAELASIVDHLVVIDAGRLLANGPTDRVLETAGTDSIEDLLLHGARA
jgi:ABC-2 type transport system ATP-binding protein